MTNPILEKMKKSLESDVVFHTTYDGEFVEEIIQLIEHYEKALKDIIENEKEAYCHCLEYQTAVKIAEKVLKG